MTTAFARPVARPVTRPLLGFRTGLIGIVGLAPLAFGEIILAPAPGWWIFGDLPDRWGLPGLAVLIGLAIYISLREQRFRLSAPSQRPPERPFAI